MFEIQFPKDERYLTESPEPVETIRRKVRCPDKNDELHVRSIYKYPGKEGTGPGTIMWFCSKPKIGDLCIGVNEFAQGHCGPDNFYAFMYQEWNYFIIDSIDSTGMVFCHKL